MGNIPIPYFRYSTPLREKKSPNKKKHVITEIPINSKFLAFKRKCFWKTSINALMFLPFSFRIENPSIAKSNIVNTT